MPYKFIGTEITARQHRCQQLVGFACKYSKQNTSQTQNQRRTML